MVGDEQKLLVVLVKATDIKHDRPPCPIESSFFSAGLNVCDAKATGRSVSSGKMCDNTAPRQNEDT